MNVHDELPGSRPTGSSAVHPAGGDLLVDELSDDVLDVIVGGVTTDAARARVAAYDPGWPPATLNGSISVPPALFRQEALDRLSSPDQLDQLMRVADPKRWIALAAIGALVAGVVVWGFVGRIDSTVQADCVIIPRGGTYDVVTTSSGTVAEVLVQHGDQLAAGEEVAVVETVDGDAGRRRRARRRRGHRAAGQPRRLRPGRRPARQLPDAATSRSASSCTCRRP